MTARKPPMMLDDSLPHQIRIFSPKKTHLLAVSCICRVRAGEPPLESRTRWEAAEAQAVYRQHLAEAEQREAAAS